MTDYLLDTNVVSELVRPNPNANVVAWVRAEDETRFYLSVLSFGEIRRGIEQLPQSPRRERLRLWLEVDLTDRFQGRILDIDRRVAEIWGMIMGGGRRFCSAANHRYPDRRHGRAPRDGRGDPQSARFRFCRDIGG